MSDDTLTEIRAQCQAWEAVLAEADGLNADTLDYLNSEPEAEAIFIGCGTSYFLALAAMSIYQGVTRKPARAVTASDVFLCSQSLFPAATHGVAFPISRSGATTETIWATKFIDEHMKFSRLAISCTPNSELVNISDMSLVADQAVEKSVVMTKSFTSMLLITQLLAASRSGDAMFANELSRLPEIGADVIGKYEDLARNIASSEESDQFVFLGQGPYYGLACESSLKMKEMSLSISEAYHSMEFRHGPTSVVGDRTLVTLLLSESCKAHELGVLQDVRKLGAKTLVICETCDDSVRQVADECVELKSGLGDYARPILYMPFIQLLGYYRALQKGLNPDRPQNITQVVVLE